MINWKQLINQAKMTPVDFTDKKPRSLKFDKKNISVALIRQTLALKKLQKWTYKQ